MKRQTYLKFFKKWCKCPKAIVLFVPDAYFKSCIKIMQKTCCYRVFIVKKSDELKYWDKFYEYEYEEENIEW